ncbi:MAG: thiamine phosphate synthase [Sulfurimonas sp.]|uniref:thiamine phosphate synthase n=1 Tax=Sulfurimonas sp. TaxID=2022749 RepID=UPI0025E4E8F6|nr:thiamine phosphate synthase [Sulfurimonas sp.]MCK9454095.1 thiamine phosphate synthase [Sulfurimonas sp.]
MQKYLITSKELYTDIPEIFCSRLDLQIKKHNPSYALYRDKSNPNYSNLAALFAKLCAENVGVKSFLHQDVELAKKLAVTGVHLASTQFAKIEDAKSLGLEVIISTHTKGEVLLAQKLGADAVTYSPIFASPNKGKPKGINDLKELLEICKIDVFALGGIVTKEHLEKIAQTKVYGFASIRYFY